MSLLTRVPKWLRGDQLVKALDEEVERIKVYSYYNYLRGYVRQPIQLWNEFASATDKTSTITYAPPDPITAEKPTITFNLENAGLFETAPTITINPKCCLSPVKTPVTITDGSNTMVYNGEIYGEVKITPDMKVMRDGFEDLSSFLTGNPVLLEPGNNTLKITFDVGECPTNIDFTIDYQIYDNFTYNARFIADEQMPLKKITLYDGNDVSITEKEYKRYELWTYDLLSLPNEKYPKFYAEVYYYGIHQPIRVGFPQHYTYIKDLDGNNTLKIIPTTSMENFTIDIKYDTLNLTTYTGYTESFDFITASDLANVVNEKSQLINVEMVGNVLTGIKEGIIKFDLKYEPNLKLGELAKGYGIWRREYKTDMGWHEILYTYPTAYPYEIEQDYWLERRILDEYTNIYKNYGLLKSEIYQYLGVVPEIIDRSDKILIWDVGREWDNGYVWAGDDWSFAVYDVEIPYAQIPANFKLLNLDELQEIIDRCKKIGTKGIPVYAHTEDVNFELETIPQDVPNSEIDLEISIGFVADDEDTINQWVDFGVQADTQLDKETDIDSSLEFGVEATGYQNIPVLTQDTDVDFKKNFLGNTEIYGSGSNAVIRLKTQTGGVYSPSGIFMTKTIKLSSTQTNWNMLNSTINVPSGSGIVFDIFKEFIDQQQTLDEDVIQFGHSDLTKLGRVFTARKEEDTSIILEAGDNIGNPIDDIKVEFFNTQDGKPYGYPLATQIIPVESWKGTVEITIQGNFNIGTQYAFTVGRVGVPNNDNYYQIKATTQTNSSTFSTTGAVWVSYNKDLYFIMKYPVYLLENQPALTDLSSIQNTDIKIRGKLSTANNVNTPFVGDLSVGSFKQIF